MASRAAWGALAIIVLAGLTVLGVFPVSTYLRQRNEIDTTNSSLEQLREDNARFEERLGLLDDDAEIERLARRDHNLVFEGEESYAILPPTPAPVEVPDVWPLNLLGEALAEL